MIIPPDKGKLAVTHVTRIDFSEIPKVEITCLKCVAALVLPVHQIDVGAFIPPRNYECLGCREELWNEENDQRLIRLVGIVRSLGYLQELKDAGFALSFSIISN